MGSVKATTGKCRANRSMKNDSLEQVQSFSTLLDRTFASSEMKFRPCWILKDRFS